MNTTQSSMKSPDEPVPDAASSDQSAWRWSWPARLAFMFTGVVMPIVCFTYVNMQNVIGGGLCWHSGNLCHYARLLLCSGDPSIPFYPFLLCSAICMTLLVFAPGRFVKTFVVRFGVYTGVLLAVQYWLVFVTTFAEGDKPGDNPLVVPAFVGLFSFGAVVIPWTVGWLIVFLSRKFRLFRNLAAVLLALSGGVWLGIGLLSGWSGWFSGFSPAQILSEILYTLAFPLFVGLFFATPWAVASYGAMAIYAARHSGVKRLQFSLAQLLGMVTWLAAFLGAWRISVVWMLQEYAKLPKTQPGGGCYVSSAAARGHRRLVGAKSYVAPWGKVYHVNDQMRYLKAAELLLAALCPTVHRLCRRAYDLIGPLLAATLIHPLLADAAYLSLKPAEWLARATLAVLLPDDEELIRRLYAGRCGGPSTRLMKGSLHGEQGTKGAHRHLTCLCVAGASGWVRYKTHRLHALGNGRYRPGPGSRQSDLGFEDNRVAPGGRR